MSEEPSPQASSPEKGAWNQESLTLLEDWRNRVYAAQMAHYSSANQLRVLHYAVGIPAVVFSSIVGTAVFGGLEKDEPRTMWVASISILAAALAALQTFMRFPERASIHATAGDWYSAIRRDIEQVLHLPVEVRDPPRKCLDAIRKEMNRAGQHAPELNVDRWRREASRFGVKEPRSPI